MLSRSTKVVIDSSVETSLMDEYLLNENKELEIVKKFQNGGAVKVYIKASHPTNKSCEDLLLKKNSDLKKIIKEENIECSDLSVTQ